MKDSKLLLIFIALSFIFFVSQVRGGEVGPRLMHSCEVDYGSVSYGGEGGFSKSVGQSFYDYKGINNGSPQTGFCYHKAESYKIFVEGFEVTYVGPNAEYNTVEKVQEKLSRWMYIAENQPALESQFLDPDDTTGVYNKRFYSLCFNQWALAGQASVAGGDHRFYGIYCPAISNMIASKLDPVTKIIPVNKYINILNPDDLGAVIGSWFVNNFQEPNIIIGLSPIISKTEYVFSLKGDNNRGVPAIENQSVEVDISAEMKDLTRQQKQTAASGNDLIPQSGYYINNLLMGYGVSEEFPAAGKVFKYIPGGNYQMLFCLDKRSLLGLEINSLEGALLSKKNVGLLKRFHVYIDDNINSKASCEELIKGKHYQATPYSFPG